MKRSVIEIKLKLKIMGKTLIIKGADFSRNSIQESINYKISPFYYHYLSYTVGNNIQRTNDTINEYLVVADVRAYRGKTLKIKTSNYVIADAYYNCFCEDLGIVQYDNIPNLNWEVNEIHPINTVIENFNVSTTDRQPNTITKVIPNTANYVVISVNTDNFSLSGVLLQIVE